MNNETINAVMEQHEQNFGAEKHHFGAVKTLILEQQNVILEQ